jgi:DNA-binding beta-propeller fold protein YncE
VLVKVLGFDPLDYSQAGMLRTLSVVLVLLSVSAVVGTWWNQRVWLVSAGIYYAIYILFYTTMFTNARGAATGFVGMLGYWLSQQTVARGGQPWYYYFFLLAVYEFLPSLLAMCGAFYHLVRSGRKRPEPALESAAGELAPTRWVFASLLVYWAITNVTVFAWTAEKMPWQNQHVTLPIALLAGWFLGDVWDRRDWHRLLKDGAARVAVLLAVALLALLVLISSMMSEPGPLSGVSLEQLAVTLRWLLALVMLGGAVLLMYRWGSRLGRRGWIRILVAALVTILIVITLRVALRLSFVNQDYATEFLVYAASTPDTGLVTRELEEMSRRLAGDMELRIAYDDESSWPFVWYLRDFPNSSFFTAGTGLTGEPQVVIVGPGNESKMKSQLSGKYLRRGYRLIWWPNQDVYANLTPLKLWRDLRDPARRSYWWDILWSRKYPQSTTSWPYVQRFALYVRKDVAAQMWDYGPEVAGAGIELPEDEYEKKRVQVAAVAAWGSYGSGEGQFDYPKSMALDSEDNLYVADSYNHRVQVLDANGQFLRQWGVQGSAPGQFQEPWGIAVDTAGYVYVADTWNHRIQKFEGDGAFVNQWGFFGDTGGALGDAAMLYGPRDLAVDMDGNLLVSDTGNKRVLRFTPEGEFLQQWGGAGSLDGQLREPVGLAVDGAGNVLVADTWNQRIQKFTNVGSFLMQWPVLGWEGEGVTNKPYLAADSKGNVYATAPDYHRVVKFDSSGRLLAAWGQFGSDSTSFNMPSDVAVDSQDNVYVLDSANHRVLKFAPAP